MRDITCFGFTNLCERKIVELGTFYYECYSTHDAIILREHGLIKEILKAESDFNVLGY